ncbi:MAG TPA: hypothetical protein VFG15_13540 [Amycolatopsis sp.]|nr:hypothetical protein [Amycolatopsis sp.]
MTAWWGLTGLLGLLGIYGLVRIRHRAGVRAESPAADAFARYPAAQGPAVPNADTAHTPLMTPVVTPEMISGPRRWRASRPSRVRAQPLPPMPQYGLTGTQAVAEPVVDAGTVPAQASPPVPETRSAAVSEAQRVAAVPETQPVAVSEAQPATVPETQPVAAVPETRETQPVAAVPEPRPMEEGTLTGELVPDRPDPEEAPKKAEAKAAEVPEPAKPEETANRFQPRRAFETALRKAKETKGLLRRN